MLTAGGYAEEDLVDDGWTEVVRKILNLMLSSGDPALSPEALAAVVDSEDGSTGVHERQPSRGATGNRADLR